MSILRRSLRYLVMALAFVIGMFGVLQLVPYGRTHTNPPVLAEPLWDSPRTRELAKRACFNCHSNETRWPWYAHVAPFSWVMQHHVTVGRSVMNFSEWTRAYELAPQAGSEVIRREMPPRGYRLLHRHADLSDAEKVELARGLHATFGIEWRD